MRIKTAVFRTRNDRIRLVQNNGGRFYAGEQIANRLIIGHDIFVGLIASIVPAPSSILQVHGGKQIVSLATIGVIPLLIAVSDFVITERVSPLFETGAQSSEFGQGFGHV